MICSVPSKTSQLLWPAWVRPGPTTRVSLWAAALRVTGPKRPPRDAQGCRRPCLPAQRLAGVQAFSTAVQGWLTYKQEQHTDPNVGLLTSWARLVLSTHHHSLLGDVRVWL